MNSRGFMAPSAAKATNQPLWILLVLNIFNEILNNSTAKYKLADLILPLNKLDSHFKPL